jgi:hypothetical protein
MKHAFLAMLCALVITAVIWCDRHYWHSFLSYNQVGLWHGCTVENPKPNIVHAKCLEGEIYYETKP